MKTEVKVLNRKLYEQTNVFENTELVKVIFILRSLFTKPRLYMNTKSKQLAAKKIVPIIKSVLNERKTELISMKWNIMKKESKRNTSYGKIKIRDQKEKEKNQEKKKEWMKVTKKMNYKGTEIGN
jgi:hypothetical protein